VYLFSNEVRHNYIDIELTANVHEDPGGFFGLSRSGWVERISDLLVSVNTKHIQIIGRQSSVGICNVAYIKGIFLFDRDGSECKGQLV